MFCLLKNVALHDEFDNSSIAVMAARRLPGRPDEFAKKSPNM
jgi:hypothetical protein